MRHHGGTDAKTSWCASKVADAPPTVRLNLRPIGLFPRLSV